MAVIGQFCVNIWVRSGYNGCDWSVLSEYIIMSGRVIMAVIDQFCLNIYVRSGYNSCDWSVLSEYMGQVRL